MVKVFSNYKTWRYYTITQIQELCRQMLKNFYHYVINLKNVDILFQKYFSDIKYDRKEGCYESPILDNPCGGEGGTGAETTQVYDAPTVDNVKC